MSRTHRCQSCAKRRVGVTVVDGFDLCPECAENYSALLHALERERVVRQTRTLAKLASVDVGRTHALLLLLVHAKRAVSIDGLWRKRDT